MIDQSRRGSVLLYTPLSKCSNCRNMEKHKLDREFQSLILKEMKILPISCISEVDRKDMSVTRAR